ncbi:hypothetical protein [Streptomyces sp. enrichment culture]|uniref:hypothetical protein n=1 Tax=Streptomyces sp. enrichment culture TaxID=1795815 RepID=UPI003F57FFBA
MTSIAREVLRSPVTERAREKGGAMDVGEGPAPASTCRSSGSLLAEGGDGRLRLTDEGRDLRARAAETQRANRTRVHDGVGDEECPATPEGPQRVIRDAGGDVRRGT